MQHDYVPTAYVCKRCPCCVKYRIIYCSRRFKFRNFQGMVGYTIWKCSVRLIEVQHVSSSTVFWNALKLKLSTGCSRYSAAAIDIRSKIRKEHSSPLLTTCRICVDEPLDVRYHVMQTYACCNHDVARLWGSCWQCIKYLRQTNPTQYPVRRNTSICSLLMNLQQSSCRMLPPLDG